MIRAIDTQIQYAVSRIKFGSKKAGQKVAEKKTGLDPRL